MKVTKQPMVYRGLDKTGIHVFTRRYYFNDRPSRMAVYGSLANKKSDAKVEADHGFYRFEMEQNIQ